MASLTHANHIVLVPFPAQGHVQPMIYLAKKFANEGFIVTIINTDSIHQVLSQTWQSVPGQDIRFESIPFVMNVPAGLDYKSMSQLRAFMSALEELELPLLNLFKRLKPEVSCVLSDYYHISAPYAAKNAGISSVAFWSGHASWFSIEYNIGELISNGHVPVEESNADQIISYLPGLKSIKVQDLPLYLYKDFHTTHFSNERCRFRAKRAAFEPYILANTFYELEPEVVSALNRTLPSKLITIGPLFPQKHSNQKAAFEVSLRAEDGETIKFLNAQSPRSVLYIAFGSVVTISFEEFKELCGGLESSGFPFVFVVPHSLVPDMPEGHVEEFCERIRGKSMVISWAPQVAVLQHDAVGGFITHCGWNSLLEGLSGGVPMLGWPCQADQNTNCKLILEQNGVGYEVPKTKHGIMAAVKSLMANQDMRCKCTEIMGLGRAAYEEGGSSYENFKAFCKEWLCTQKF